MNIHSQLARLSIYRKLSSIYRYFVNREKHTSYGSENPDKIFYIIGQDDRRCGLWWIINKVLMHLAYADEKGYQPVVDYKNFETMYHNPGELYNLNVWEKFFNQPIGLTLEDVSCSRNIILSDHYASPQKKYLMGNTDFYTNIDRRNYFRSIFQKYISFNEETLNYLENERQTIIPHNTRTLGVLCRGTDYLLKKPHNHPVQPEPEVVVQMVSETMEKYNCDNIFLATEDADILALFKKEFGEKLLYVEQKRISHDEMDSANMVMELNIKKNNDKYMMGLKYLTATYILSKCNCFIGGRTGGTKGVLLMTNGFEFEHVFNLGFYK